MVIFSVREAIGLSAVFLKVKARTTFSTTAGVAKLLLKVMRNVVPEPPDKLAMTVDELP